MTSLKMSNNNINLKLCENATPAHLILYLQKSTYPYLAADESKTALPPEELTDSNVALNSDNIPIEFHYFFLRCLYDLGKKLCYPWTLHNARRYVELMAEYFCKSQEKKVPESWKKLIIKEAEEIVAKNDQNIVTLNAINEETEIFSSKIFIFQINENAQNIIGLDDEICNILKAIVLTNKQRRNLFKTISKSLLNDYDFDNLLTKTAAKTFNMRYDRSLELSTENSSTTKPILSTTNSFLAEMRGYQISQPNIFYLRDNIGFGLLLLRYADVGYKLVSLKRGDFVPLRQRNRNNEKIKTYEKILRRAGETALYRLHDDIAPLFYTAVFCNKFDDSNRTQYFFERLFKFIHLLPIKTNYLVFPPCYFLPCYFIYLTKSDYLELNKLECMNGQRLLAYNIKNIKNQEMLVYAIKVISSCLTFESETSCINILKEFHQREDVISNDLLHETNVYDFYMPDFEWPKISFRHYEFSKPYYPMFGIAYNCRSEIDAIIRHTCPPSDPKTRQLYLPEVQQFLDVLDKLRSDREKLKTKWDQQSAEEENSIQNWQDTTKNFFNDDFFENKTLLNNVTIEWQKFL